MNQPIQGLSASLVVVIVPSLSPREVLAFVEAHFLSPDSRARPDLKTKEERVSVSYPVSISYPSKHLLGTSWAAPVEGDGVKPLVSPP